MPSAEPEGGRGPDPHPLENHKSIGFLSNTGFDKAKRLLNGVSLEGRWWPAFSGNWSSPSLF